MLQRSRNCRLPNAFGRKQVMQANELKRDDILSLAHQSKLMIVDGEIAYLNDMATDKELITFVRLLEARCVGHENSSRR